MNACNISHVLINASVNHSLHPVLMFCDVISHFFILGEKGDKGDVGDEGLPGSQGRPGPKGQVGFSGSPGPMGFKVRFLTGIYKYTGTTMKHNYNTCILNGYFFLATSLR